ncbi:MAG: fibronectin type III domain-containing protein [Ignavibacteriaceae bacterium]|nr:fibronectin type III domain-containing protein [Ignavibacteriaceae bacterium]
MKILFILLFSFFIIIFSSCKKDDSNPTQPTNNAPSTPSNPIPIDGTTEVSRSPVLSWTCSDPDAGDSVKYDLYLASVNPPNTLTASSWIYPNYSLTGLDTNRTYYWRVTAKDSRGASSVGPIWRFTTTTQNIIYQDDFESYQLGSFPPGWVSNGVTTGITISNYAYHSSAQCLKISGVGGLSGVFRLIPTFPDTASMEFWIKSPSNLPGTDTSWCAFGIETYWQISFFAQDSSILLNDYYTPGFKFLGYFQPGNWYKMKVKYNKIDNKLSCWANDVLLINNTAILPYPSGLFRFAFGTSDSRKEFYIDDLIIW